MVYKVVRNTGDVLRSFTSSDHELIYTIRERTYPVVGKIFAFATYESARDFYRRENCYSSYDAIGEIWAADADIYAFHISYIPDIGNLTTSDIAALFEGGWYPVGGAVGVGRLPGGTVFCNWIFLRERLI